MAYNRKQQELSPSASLIKKNSKPPNMSDMMDKMANTVTHFEDILRTELTAVEYVCVAYTQVYGSCMFGDGHVGAEMSKGRGWFCFGGGYTLKKFMQSYHTTPLFCAHLHGVRSGIAYKSWLRIYGT